MAKIEHIADLLQAAQSGAGVIWGDTARWALAEIERLSRTEVQIDGLVKCAEVSDATERTTLLLKLAAAEQRIADRDREIERLGQQIDQSDCESFGTIHAHECEIAALRAALAAMDAALAQIAALTEEQWRTETEARELPGKLNAIAREARGK